MCQPYRAGMIIAQGNLFNAVTPDYEMYLHFIILYSPIILTLPHVPPRTLYTPRILILKHRRTEPQTSKGYQTNVL